MKNKLLAMSMLLLTLTSIALCVGPISAEDVHDVAVTDVTVSKNAVYQGLSVDINVTVANLGNVTESSFTVTLYRNITATTWTAMTTWPVSGLVNGTTSKLSFVWNTAGVQFCHDYVLKANATVPGDINATNDEFVDGKVHVKMLCDVNGDRIIDISDINLAIAAFGTKPGNPRWNPECEFNLDGKIDAVDIAMVISQYGKKC